VTGDDDMGDDGWGRYCLGELAPLSMSATRRACVYICVESPSSFFLLDRGGVIAVIFSRQLRPDVRVFIYALMFVHRSCLSTY
jgi:hypothetical protein